MTYLRDLKDVLQRQMPLWATSKVVPRGLLIPLDPFLRGTARAAKKVGDSMPVLVPNNTATLAVELHTEDTTITLNDNTLSYVAQGFLLSLGGQRVVGVANKTGNVITLMGKAGVSMQQGETISVFAFPVRMLGSYLVPDPPLPRPDIITLKSAVQLMQGDYLDISDVVNFGSYNEYEVVEVIASRKSTLSEDSANPYIYQVRISQVIPQDIPDSVAETITSLNGIPRDLVDGEIIYLRAFPAYFSKPLPVSSQYFNVTTAEIGPYILDRVSGLVIDNPESKPADDTNPAGEGQVDVDEVLEVELLHASLNLFEKHRLGVREQLPVWNPTIEPEHMVMWRALRGFMDFEDGFVVLNLDDNGLGELETPLVPELGLDLEHLPTYTLISQSDSPFKICLEFYPNGYSTDSSPSPSPDLYTSSLSFSFAGSGETPRAIKITVQGYPGQRIKLHSLAPSLPRITNIRYRILARTVGNYHWASSGLLQKPMWMSAYLTEAIGIEVPLDGGKVMYQGRKTQPQKPSSPSGEC